MRRTLAVLATLATVATATLTGAGPAHAADGDVTTIELTTQKDVSLGEAQKILDAAVKSGTDSPHAVAVISDQGVVPTPKQMDSLLAGRGVDGFKVYRTLKEPTPDTTYGVIVDGTPLPAVAAYKTNNGGLTRVVIIICADYCRIYSAEYNLT
jgi:hypothetical protein